jgi:antitoxin component YwqK of YwqJK toxin-antitoxin module
MVKIGYKKCTSNTLKYKNVRCIIGIFEIEEDAIIYPNIENTFAKYKVNKCKLIRIEHVNGDIIDDLKSVIATIFFSKEPPHEYKLNEEFDIETQLTSDFNIQEYGILMFFERQRAEMYLLETIENGLLIQWRDNGIKYCEENYTHYLKNGICKYYHPNGVLKEEAKFGTGYKNGIEKIYDINGKLISEKDFTPRPICDYHYKT